MGCHSNGIVFFLHGYIRIDDSVWINIVFVGMTVEFLGCLKDPVIELLKAVAEAIRLGVGNGYFIVFRFRSI